MSGPLENQPLCGPAEICEHLGVTRGWIIRRRTETSSTFPPPHATVSRVPIWHSADVLRWHEAWKAEQRPPTT